MWADIDLDHAVIRVRFQRSREGKRARIKTPAAVRDVVLMDELAHLLRKAKMASHFKRPQDPVFATGNRTSLSQRNATRAFEKSVERAKLSDVTFHALRHTFASLLIAQGRDPVFVADQLGHTSLKTTLGVYGHLFHAAREARRDAGGGGAELTSRRSPFEPGTAHRREAAYDAGFAPSAALPEISRRDLWKRRGSARRT